MLVPPQKADILARAESEVKEIEQQYVSGLVTAGERYNKVVDIWGKAGDDVSKVMMDQLKVEKTTDRHGKEVNQESFNAIYMMRLGRPGFRRADPPAGRHARPDGQAGRLHHSRPPSRRTSVKA